MPTYSPLFGSTFRLATKSPLERAFFRLARRNQKVRELLDTLIAGAVGDPAVRAYKRVPHSITELGGKRVATTRTVINRNTVAADATAMQFMINTDHRITMPVNKGYTFRGL